MVYRNISGFESGSLVEADTTSGTVSVQSTTKRTGTYALRVNPTAGIAWARFGDVKGSLITYNLNGAAAHYITVYFRYASFPGATTSVVDVGTSAGASTVKVTCSSAGVLSIVGTTTVGGPTISTGIWYRLDLLALKDGTCTAAIDGGTSFSATGNAQFIGRVFLGSLASATFDCYYDDLAISDSAYPGAGQVNILKPNATGNYTAWTNGAGTAPTNVAEVPNDADTGYITSLVTNDAETEAMDSAATGGVSGTIGTVRAIAICRDLTGTATIKVRVRSASTDSDLAVNNGLTTTYAAYNYLLDLDPATTATWTSSGLDSLEVGVVDGNGITARCTALYAMVWCTGNVTTPKTLAVTSTATATMTRSVGKILNATSTGTATIVRRTNKILAVTSTGTATVLKSVGKILSAISTVSATMTRSYAFGLVLSVTSTGTATMTRSVGKILSVTSTGTATMTRSVGKILSVTSTGLATLSMAVSRFTAPLNIPLWTKGLYKPLRFKPPRYRKPF